MLNFHISYYVDQLPVMIFRWFATCYKMVLNWFRIS